jgi:predicted O-methyltransferase YrrM
MDRFLGSTHDIKDKVSIHRGFSSDILKKPELMDRQYDIIYIDGDHHSWSALEDAVLAFPLLKSGGLLIFDDYLYGDIKTCNSPHLGINAFISAYKDRIRDLYAGYQVFLYKK